MSLRSFSVTDCLTRWYLRAARSRLRRDLPPPCRWLLSRWPKGMELVRNLAHWLSQRAYRETHRTFAHLDYTICLVLPSGEFAAVRGWIVDLEDSLTGIRFPEIADMDQFVYYGDHRPDVDRSLPGERAWGSGFVALLPLGAVEGRKEISVSYETRGGIPCTLRLTLPGLAYGVRHPPAPERSPDGQPLGSTLILAARREAESEKIAAELASLLSRSGVDPRVAGGPGIGCEATRSPRLEAGNDVDLAGVIGRHRRDCRLLVIVGPLTRQSYEQLLPAVVSAFPHPRVVWISPDPVPAGIAEPGLVETLHWREQSPPELAERLAALAGEPRGGSGGSR